MDIKKIKIPSGKGNLSASVHSPANTTDRLAILCPGFLDSKDYRHLVRLADELCDNGFAVVRFNPIGTWDSGGTISDYTTSQYLKDIQVVLEYMLDREKYTHILLGGHSRGGQVSILYAAKDPRISMVLGIMPSSGPMDGPAREEWEKNGIKISKRDLPDNKNKEKQFEVPFNHVLDSDKYDTVAAVKRISVPKIFITGELDDTVPAEDVEELFNNANEIKKFVNIPNIGHGYRRDENEISIVNKEILKQLNAVLGQ
jgi:uncharacterized protein